MPGTPRRRNEVHISVYDIVLYCVHVVLVYSIAIVSAVLRTKKFDFVMFLSVRD